MAPGWTMRARPGGRHGAACPGRRWWRPGRARYAGSIGPRSVPGTARRAEALPAHDLRPRQRTRASGSSTDAVRAGTGGPGPRSLLSRARVPYERHRSRRAAHVPDRTRLEVGRGLRSDLSAGRSMNFLLRHVCTDRRPSRRDHPRDARSLDERTHGEKARVDDGCFAGWPGGAVRQVRRRRLGTRHR
jgi:hypothetical protein